MKIETSETFKNLCELPIGARLVVQCKKDWRTAVVSSISAEKIVLIIAAPSGRTYRKSCLADTVIKFEGEIPLLGEGIWREDFAIYDFRW